VKYRAKNVQEDKVGETLYLFSEETGYIYELNETGSEIWSLLKEGLDEDQIAEELSRKYGVDTALVEEDLRKFIVELKKYGLISEEEIR